MSSKSSPRSNDIVMAPEIVRFDPEAFDMLLRSNGVVMEHYRAVLCPLGVTDKFDARQHGHHSNCSNGFVYKYAGDVTVFFTGNGSTAALEDIGLVDGSTVQVTLPRYYDNSEKEVMVQHYDRFFLKEVATRSVNTQLVEAHITGKDRLQYKAVGVEHVMDSDGKEYSLGDYVIEDGYIVWKTSNRPQFDPKTQRGTVYSIRYTYVPFWYAKNIIHEVRVSRIYDHAKEKDVLVRLPYAVQLQREYMFENEERELNGKSDARDVKAPRSGSFGPR